MLKHCVITAQSFKFNKTSALTATDRCQNFHFFLVDVFTGIASVDHDFIRVDVKTSSGETKSDVHMHVFPKKEVLERPTKPGGIPLNVALIMFDSTSAVNFRRKMPNSLEYLTKNLDSLLMQGKHFTTSFPGPFPTSSQGKGPTF